MLEPEVQVPRDLASPSNCVFLVDLRCKMIKMMDTQKIFVALLHSFEQLVFWQESLPLQGCQL